MGPSGSAVVTLSQLPRRTAPSAASASAVASVVLPTPASPPRNTSRPPPSAASPSSPLSEARKPPRSISTSVIKAPVSGGAKAGPRGRGGHSVHGPESLLVSDQRHRWITGAGRHPPSTPEDAAGRPVHGAAAPVLREA